MDSNTSPVLIVCGTVILLAVLGGIFTLAWHGTFTGAECFGIVTTIITGTLGVFAVHTGVKSGGKAASGQFRPTHAPLPTRLPE